MSKKPEKSNNQVSEDVGSESEDKEKKGDWDGVERREGSDRRTIAYLQGQERRKSKERRSDS